MIAFHPFPRSNNWSSQHGTMVCFNLISSKTSLLCTYCVVHASLLVWARRLRLHIHPSLESGLCSAHFFKSANGNRASKAWWWAFCRFVRFWQTRCRAVGLQTCQYQEVDWCLRDRLQSSLTRRQVSRHHQRTHFHWSPFAAMAMYSAKIEIKFHLECKSN